MRKAATHQILGRRAWPWLAGSSLVVLLAAFGCSTNPYDNTLNGEPAQVTPFYNPTTPAVTPGNSSGTEGVPPPMASSFIYSNSPSVNTDALATLAADQGYQGRVLGPIGAQGPQTVFTTQPTGQVQNLAYMANSQSTVNPTLGSPGTPVITGGTVGGGDVFTAPATIGALATTAAAPLTVTGAVGVGALPPSGAVVPATPAFSPTISGAATFAPSVTNTMVTGTTPVAPATGLAAAGATAPEATSTIAVGANPAAGTVVPSTTGTSPTVTGSAVFTPMASSSTIVGTTTTPGQMTQPLTAPRRAAVRTTTAVGTAALVGTTATGAVRLVTQPNGSILITNVKK